jgi:hypothetical protein
MQHTKQEKPGTEFPLSNPLGEMFAHNANLWFTTHAELLANVDALTHAWLSRRRDGVDSNDGIASMTQKAATNFEKTARKVAEPLHAVSEEMLKAAGNKPHRGKSGGPGIVSP